MRKISAGAITELVSKLCIEANTRLRSDIRRAIASALRKETAGRAKKLLQMLLDNADLALKEHIAICQDTGMAAVFAEIGQDVHITGGSLEAAVNEGVRRGYKEGYFRKSVVASPLSRENTGTNTPAILHTEIVPGNSFNIWVMAKGFGSENKSAIKMFNPTASEDEIIDFIISVTKEAGPDACPPFVVGVGIGGTFDHAAHLAKRSLLREIDKENKDPKLAALEKKLLEKLNKLGTGPMGLGGKTTALGVTILSTATHIAGLPVAVNISCHATRSAYGRL
ncbi:MAG: fumarate hydratase [Candidatus Omnitrophota bacterium]|nr:fumarate hydratase [Candidatus Omnitrophota bacterium]